MPMFVHVPAPAGERWNWTSTIDESASLAVPSIVTVPRR
jgi:hypothetical protein